MNKIFAFLCVNTVAFTTHAKEDKTQTRVVDFTSWYNFTNEEETQRAGKLKEIEEEEEETQEGEINE